MKYPLTGDYLANLPEPMQKLYRDLEDSIFEYICEQFKTGDANEKSIELIRLLQRRGLSLREIEKRIQRTLGLTKRELDRIYDGAISRNRAFFTDTLNKMKLVFDPKRRKAMEAEEAAIRAQTLDELTNITRSLGFATRGPDGRVVATSIMEAYQRILDVALIQAQSGAFSAEEAIQNAIKQLAASGIQWVDYESGWHNRVEVAARRAVMTGISQLSARYSEQMRQEIGTEFVEVSAHRGARDKGIGPENHKSWQGKVYHIGGDTVVDGVRYPDFERVTGYGVTGAGLNGWNCRHKWYPFVPGINEPTYTEEELANIRKFSNFDVYGHLDYVVRYGAAKDADYSYDKYKDILDKILTTLLEKEKGIELNTGGIKSGMKDFHPCMDVLKRYRELGGEIITVGSDAHEPSHIADSFDRAYDVLKECGFKYYTVFEKRLPEYIKL